jgi:hypothetical protein
MGKDGSCCGGVLVVVVILGLLISFASGDKDRTTDLKDELQPVVEAEMVNSFNNSSYNNITIENVTYKSFDTYLLSAGWGYVLDVKVNALKNNETPELWKFRMVKKDPNDYWNITSEEKLST